MSERVVHEMAEMLDEKDAEIARLRSALAAVREGTVPEGFEGPTQAKKRIDAKGGVHYSVPNLDAGQILNGTRVRIYVETQQEDR